MGEVERRMRLGLTPIQQQVQINLDNATQQKCVCGCNFFMPVVMVYTVSALISPVGKELTAQQQVLVCLECRKPLVLNQEVAAS